MLHHVSLEVGPEDVEDTAQMLELLGFTRVSAPEPLAGLVSWLECEGTQIHLIHAERPSVPRLGHAAIVVADFGRAVARLREAGHAVEDARELWGAPRAFALTPGGHRVELMAAPPTASERRARGAGSPLR